MRILDNEKAETLGSFPVSAFGAVTEVFTTFSSFFGASAVDGSTVRLLAFSSEFGTWDLLFGISAFGC
ncbi:MAG: hypothetical protein ABI850_03795 [Flavobacterium sp.]